MIHRKISSWNLWLFFSTAAVNPSGLASLLNTASVYEHYILGFKCPVHFGTSIQIQLPHPINDHIWPESEKTPDMLPPPTLSSTVTVCGRLSDTFSSPRRISLLSSLLSTHPAWQVREDGHVSKTAAFRGFHDRCPEPIITF